VDKAGADQYNITSLEDFARDEVRQAYDADGNGKADLVACPSDWSCSGVIGFQLDAGGLRDYIDERGDPYDESMQKRFRDGSTCFSIRGLRIGL
jgi:glycine betaine/proline transport system substrate-binding protein